MSRALLDKVRSITAIALIGLTAAVALGPLLHAEAGHDSDCASIVVVHDSSQHAFGAAPTAASESLPSHDHCVTCHLFRISRVSQDASVAHSCDQSVRALATPGENFRLSDPASIQLPARAPPGSR